MLGIGTMAVKGNSIDSPRLWAHRVPLHPFSEARPPGYPLNTTAKSRVEGSSPSLGDCAVRRRPARMPPAPATLRGRRPANAGPGWTARVGFRRKLALPVANGTRDGFGLAALHAGSFEVAGRARGVEEGRDAHGREGTLDSPPLSMRSPPPSTRAAPSRGPDSPGSGADWLVRDSARGRASGRSSVPRPRPRRTRPAPGGSTLCSWKHAAP